MSAFAPTPEQAAAIAARAAETLVEAGAGTGKTRVMVDRYCRLVCEEGVPTEAILAFTFTEKAAAELRQRIAAQLGERAEAGSGLAREALAGFGGAWVTTIHGFCNRLLAAHPVAAGIDPGYRVLDAHEAKRAAREAFERALEEFLARGGEDREETLAAFGVEGLRAIVSGAHEELRSRGQAEPRLPRPEPTDPAPALCRALTAAREALEELRPTNGNRALLERAVATLASGAPDLDRLVALRTDSTAKALAVYREAIETAVARVAEADEGGVAYGHMAELLELFSAHFAAAKERRAGVDFEDLQALAARLLERTEVGERYRRRFRHLMVDEFQDTNRLQLSLIEALRGPEAQLMMVGDEFQSIYGFRHADLDLFRERRRLVADSADGEVLELSGNFRSRPPLIAAVNAMAGALFGPSFRPLRVGAAPACPTPPWGEPGVELLLTARDGWDDEGIDLEPPPDATSPPSCVAEARFVAERLRALADAGAPAGGMVVLLRAFTHLDAHEDALERAGLRPFVVGGRGYWSQQQTADVCALLATLANPLDDAALLSSLASPACGVAPDTLWLLRAAAGSREPIWSALRAAAGNGDASLADAGRLEQIPEVERELLRRFVETLEGLRAYGTRLPLAATVEAVVAETGYDLAVLLKPQGEARFANVRKLIRLAAEYEAHEGRDLRGLLDFLAARAEADGDAQAATAAEGHDGVRIMTVHNAKGLEFDIVAVPDLARGMLAGSRSPVLALGRGGDGDRVGLHLRRLGASPIPLYSYPELTEEAKARDAEEGLRLFYVAATRAREHLILSGVARPEPTAETRLSTPVIERLIDAFSIPRDRDSAIAVPAPAPRPGLDAELGGSEIAVRVNLPSPARARELRASRRRADAPPEPGRGPAPLVARRPGPATGMPLSYTAIDAYEKCGYRFQLERVLRLGAREEGAEGGHHVPSTREERSAYGSAVHALLEWSHAHDWAEPPSELARRHALAAGLSLDGEGTIESLLASVRRWLGSELLRERVMPGTATRAEVPILLWVGGAVLRGSIDLLVERDGAPPLVVDYKTDRLGDPATAAGESPGKPRADGPDGVQGPGGPPPAGVDELMERYRTQQAIYALAVAESRRAPEVEVAYAFLEAPAGPAPTRRFDAAGLERERERLVALIARIMAGEFPAAPSTARSWRVCSGCPALELACSGPPGELGVAAR